MISTAALVAAFAFFPQGEAGGKAPAGRPGTPLPVPRAIVERRRDRRIDVDGSLLDWPTLPPIEMVDARQLSGTAQGAWRGPADLAAFVFLLWDEKDLYVGATVQDDWHRAMSDEGSVTSEIPPCDSLVLTFDPDRDTRDIGPDPGRAEDRTFWIAEEASHKLLCWDPLRGTASQPESGSQVVSHDKENGLTTYEARIPWEEILPPGREPATGTVFDLQVIVNDCDEVTDSMPQTRVGWTFGCGTTIDPGLFGSAMLVDDAKSLGRMPEFPEAPHRGHGVEGPDAYRELLEGLAANGPAVYDGNGPAETAGGIRRLGLLERLEDQCERFPRVDWLQLHQRIHRRMLREVAGAMSRGLPWFWNAALVRVRRKAEEDVPERTMRLFRLPMGGWLVRTKLKNFGIDAAGNDLAEMLWGGLEFVLVTQPLDITRRNDQLLLRMASAKEPRPYLTHAALHLPLVSMADETLVEPGHDYGQATGAMVHALGEKLQDGSVPYALPYRVDLPGGLRLLVTGPATTAEELPAEPVAAILMTPRNPHAVQIARRIPCDVVILDDQFVPQTWVAWPRVRLRNLFALQKALLPTRSVLLAPGEHFDVSARE
ncbi:MAG: hypothetical protein Fur0037_16020 [Planctomycetota bacterium]